MPARNNFFSPPLIPCASPACFLQCILSFQVRRTQAPLALARSPSFSDAGDLLLYKFTAWRRNWPTRPVCSNDPGLSSLCLPVLASASLTAWARVVRD